MGPHSTWFELLPGHQTLRDNLQIYLGRRWTWQIFTATHFEISHMLGGLLVFLLLAFFAVRYAASVRKAPDAGAVPPPRFCLRNFLELLGDMVAATCRSSAHFSSSSCSATCSRSSLAFCRPPPP